MGKKLSNLQLTMFQTLRIQQIYSREVPLYKIKLRVFVSSSLTGFTQMFCVLLNVSVKLLFF